MTITTAQRRALKAIAKGSSIRNIETGEVRRIPGRWDRTAPAIGFEVVPRYNIHGTEVQSVTIDALLDKNLITSRHSRRRPVIITRLTRAGWNALGLWSS